MKVSLRVKWRESLRSKGVPRIRACGAHRYQKTSRGSVMDPDNGGHPIISKYGGAEWNQRLREAGLNSLLSAFPLCLRLGELGGASTQATTASPNYHPTLPLTTNPNTNRILALHPFGICCIIPPSTEGANHFESARQHEPAPCPHNPMSPNVTSCYHNAPRAQNKGLMSDFEADVTLPCRSATPKVTSRTGSTLLKSQSHG